MRGRSWRGGPSAAVNATAAEAARRPSLREMSAGRISSSAAVWLVTFVALGGLARGGDGVPLGAEGVDALALEVAGGRVVREVVQRVTVVGHLHLAVVALGGAEQARLDPGA